MSQREARGAPSSLGLAEHQSRFVELVTGDEGPRRVILVSPPGYGKTTAVAISAKTIAQRAPSARVLIIAPRMLLPQLAAVFQEGTGPEVHVVDAPVYRRLQLRTPAGGNPWSGPGVYLTSPEFMRVANRSAEASNLEWDLVMFDEVQLYGGGSKGELLDLFWRSPTARRVTATVSLPDTLDEASWADAVVVRWDAQVLTALHQQRVPHRVVRVHTFHLTPEERAFQAAVEASVAADSARRDQSGLAADLILQRLRSSPFAIEQTLRRAKTAAAEWEPGDEGPDEWVSADYGGSAGSRAMTGLTAATLNALLAKLDTLERDSKWAACENLLRSIRREYVGLPVVLFTDYADTAEYVAELLTARQWNVLVSTGRVPPEDRAIILDQAEKTPGIVLITTAAASQGAELSFTNQVVHYDVPPDPRRLVMRFARVERLGSTFQEVHHHMLLHEGDLLVRELQKMIQAVGQMERAPETDIEWQ